MSDGEGLVDVVVEWLAGELDRYEWLDHEGKLVHVYTAKDKVPAEHYGCVPAAISPGDGELLDAFLLRDVPRRPGERVRARVIGVLLRSDGDHKLATVDPAHHAARTVADLPPERRDGMQAFVQRQHTILGWDGPEAAQSVLRDARRVWQLRHGAAAVPADM